MTVIVRDDGFTAEDWSGPIRDLASDAEPSHDMLTERCIRIDFPTFADGRGFTIAKRLRLMGYTGRLRAAGHVIADQYAMARRAGFDEVEISEDLAARQPENQWRRRAEWRNHDYQARMRQG